MGKVDVINAFFESFELLRQNYRDVLIPIMVLLLLSGSANFGGGSIGRLLNSEGSGPQTVSLASPAAAPAAIPAVGAFMAMLGGLLLALLIVAVAIILILSIMHQAVLFYACEYFYALLRKKKITAGWQGRMKRFLMKALLLLAFWLLLLLVIVGIPTALAYLASMGLLTIAVALLAMLVLLVVGFFLIPVWVYYAMDNLPLIESAKKSVALVKANTATFTIFATISFLLSLGAGLASVSACCLSFVVTPIMHVFMALLSAITLMKIKLALEK